VHVCVEMQASTWIVFRSHAIELISTRWPIWRHDLCCFTRTARSRRWFVNACKVALMRSCSSAAFHKTQSLSFASNFQIKKLTIVSSVVYNLLLLQSQSPHRCLSNNLSMRFFLEYPHSWFSSVHHGGFVLCSAKCCRCCTPIDIVVEVRYWVLRRVVQVGDHDMHPMMRTSSSTSSSPAAAAALCNSDVNRWLS